MKKKKTKAKAKSKAVKKPKAKRPLKTKAKAKVKKSSAKRSSAKKAKKKAPKKSAVAARPGVIAPVNGVLLGIVEDYYAKIGVIALTLKSPVVVGQKIQVLGHTTNFEETVDSMQIDHVSVTQAAAKDGVGIKVIGRARAGDHVYLLK